MKYLVLLEGVGEGCDYTIGCNKNWEEMDLSDDIKEAKTQAVKHVAEWYGSDRVESVQLVPVASIETVDLQGYLDEQERKERQEEAAKKEAAEKAEYERLKEKFE